MDEIREMTCTVISPMFSYGNNKRLEPRATEMKGLLRNTYRIANPALSLKELYQYDMMLFGGQMKESGLGEIKIKASPIRLQMEEKGKGKGENQKGYEVGDKFNFKFSVNKRQADFSAIEYLKDRDEKQWYADLINLSLVLGGIGKEARWGRGCMTNDDIKNITIEKLPEWVAERLNAISSDSKAYGVLNGEVKLLPGVMKPGANGRPVIAEVSFNKILLKDQNYHWKSVRDIKENAKSILERKKQELCGDKENEVTLSVIVSLVEVKKHIVPVNTLLYMATKK